MPRPTQENLRALPDFQTVYNWSVRPVRVPAGIIIPPNLDFQCQTSTIPTSSNQTIDVDVRGHKIHQTGIESFDGTFDLQLVETVDSAIAEWFKTWRAARWQTNTGIARTRNEASIDFQLQLLNRQDEPTRLFTMIGGILSTYTIGDLSGDSSDIIRPTASIMYDYFSEI